MAEQIAQCRSVKTIDCQVWRGLTEKRDDNKDNVIDLRPTHSPLAVSCGSEAQITHMLVTTLQKPASLKNEPSAPAGPTGGGDASVAYINQLWSSFESLFYKHESQRNTLPTLDFTEKNNSQATTKFKMGPCSCSCGANCVSLHDPVGFIC